MTMNRSPAGGFPRGTPAPRRWAQPPGLALLALAAVAMIQAGCRSDGCSTCGLGGLGTKFTNGVQALGSRVLHHKDRAIGGESGGCCGGGGVEEGTIIDSGVSMAPGGMISPQPLIPAPVESGPTDLRPLDDKGASPAPTGATSTPAQTHSRNQPTGTNRSAYEASRRPTVGRGRASDVARAVHSPPAPGGGGSAASASPDLLDNLPPVDLPAEVTNKAIAPAANLPAAAPSPAAKEATPTVEGRPAAAPVAENLSATEGPVITLPSIAATVGQGSNPGILRCSSVEPHLMGGSLPTAEGLDWLNQRGYKTFLDLRGRDEVDPSFVDSVYDRGMVYVALPIMANRLDPSRLARFDDLVSQADIRPLYFCDADGTRAGLAWYIHRISIDHYDPQAAAHEVEEMGLAASGLKDATAYLSAHGVAPRPRAALMGEPVPGASPGSNATPPRPAEQASRSAEVELPPSTQATMTAHVDEDTALPKDDHGPAPLAPATESAPVSEPSAEVSDVMRPQVSKPKEVFRDPMAWKPIAGLLLAAIGLPLAYWSRSAVSLARMSRANRPAKGRRSLEAPPASDA